MIAAIVLSGGKSERMGSPKALLEYRGQTFLARILETIASAGVECCIVVAGHHHRLIADAFPDVHVVFNPDYEQGMSTSVKAGLRALPPEAPGDTEDTEVDGAAIFLVDHPLIDRSTIEALNRGLVPGHIVVPVHGGRRGHPVVFSADLFGEILSLAPDQGLNTVVRRNHDRVVEVIVDDAGILQDIDTPEQFSKLLAGEL